MKEKRLKRNVFFQWCFAVALHCCAFNSLMALPEAPSIDRSVTEIQGLGNGSNAPATMTRPHIPVNHTTGDGRVGIDIKPLSAQNRVEFYLYVPEKMNTPLMEATPGPNDIMWTGRVDIDLDTFVSEILDSGAAYEGDIRHVTLIDRTREFDDGTSQSNPRNVGGEDVYDLLVYATLDWRDAGRLGNPNSPHEGYMKMQTTPITVYVSNPKTASAAIREIVVDPSGNGKEASSDFIHIARLFENKFTHDGKLMVARVGVFTPEDPLYYAPDTGVQTSTNFMDTVYAYSSDGSLDGDPSDNRDGFDNIIPISYAPYDPRLNGEYLNDGDPNTDGEFYPFAAFPFRDGSGTLIPPGEDFGGSYPWIDSDGRTLAMSTVQATLNDDNSNPRYPNTRFDTSMPENLVEDGGPFQNQSMVGLWTQGKLVAMDNSLNNIDYGIGKELDEHRWVTLYESGVSGLPITDGRIRVGSGRDNNNIQMHGGAGNTTFFDTIENRFSYDENLRTVMPRDVVWWVSNGKSTAQFAFDDYLNKDSFIVSKMTGALEFDPAPNGSGRFFYYDGWDDVADAFTEEVRIANDACAVGDTVANEALNIDPNSPVTARWNIPANGLVTGSGARLEPIAHGGIEGKGLWLDSSMSIEYTVPVQPAGSYVDETSWYFGLFVDSREDSASERRLITFPDGSSINLLGRESLRYRDTGGATVATVTLPDAASLAGTDVWDRNEWRHLGFQLFAIDQGGGVFDYAIDFYHNGFLAHSLDLPAKMFQMDPGTLRVGDAPGATGYRGWFDDFKVFAHTFVPEVCANLARGTLVGFDAVPGVNDAMVQRAELYRPSALVPSVGEQDIKDMLFHTGQLSEVYDYYAVHYDYTTHDGGHLGNIPAGTTSIREDIVFPEAPLFNDTHRPDSGGNMFCFSCHSGSNPALGLQVSALTLDGATLAKNDFRRQPTQALRRVFGNIPANWIEAGVPASSTVAPAGGLLIDELILSGQNAGARVASSLSLTDSFNVVLAKIEGGPINFVSGDKIRANLDASQGSVRFQIKEAGTSTVVQTSFANEAPYSIDVPTSLPSVYDITATPFADDNGTGTSGIEITVSNVTFGGTSVPVTGVSVSPASASVDEGLTVALTATVSPANASNQSVNWTSSNASVATVDGSGVVTGVSAGTATITATTVDGGFTDSSAITVNAAGGIPIGQTIALRSADENLYVNVDSGDGDRVEANISSLSGTSQHFVVEDAGGGKIALRSASSNNYVWVDQSDNQKKMYATGTSIADTSVQFFWNELSSNTVRLTNANNGNDVHHAGGQDVLRARFNGTSTLYQWVWEIVP